MMDVKSHIVGIGGVFFKANNAGYWQQWYMETLGFSPRFPFDEIQSYPYGKFGWVMDPEGNKIEFWELDKEYFVDKYD